MRTFNSALAAALLGAAALMAGCSSGSDDDTPGPATGASTDVPSSAQQSIEGLIAYLGELIAGTGESTEPILVGDAELPTSETAEASN